MILQSKILTLFLILIIYLYSYASLADSLSELEVNDLDYNNPIVITPVRMKQPIKDIPGAVTVITAEMIRRYGIQTITEAMRLVPGIHITYKDAEIVVNYHGTNSVQPRRMNVQMDGNSLYRPGFATVSWNSLPVSIRDIDRIEIIRSPSSASYGPNSFMGVVNIITLHPEKTKNLLAGRVDTDSGGEGYGRAKIELGNTVIRISAEKKVDKGFDKTNNNQAYHSGTDINRMNGRSISQLNDNNSLEFSISLAQGVVEQNHIDTGQQSYPDKKIQDFYLSGEWKHIVNKHEVQLRGNYFHGNTEQRWDSCQTTAFLLPEARILYELNPDYVLTLFSGSMPSGGTSEDDAALADLLAAISNLGTNANAASCGQLNQDFSETRKTIEIVDTFQALDNLRIVSTIGYRIDEAYSETFLDGNVSLDTFNASINGEIRYIDSLTINLGGYYEKNDFADGNFAPRVAINYHITPKHTLRAATSRSFRTPDIFEQNAIWSYTLRNIDPNYIGTDPAYPFAIARSPSDVGVERIDSQEIGYYGNFKEYGTIFDIKIFRDHLTQLISSQLDLFNFNPDNNGSAILTGAEFEANIRPNNKWLINLGAAYLDNDTEYSIERTQYTQWSGFIAGSYSISSEWQTGLSYYGASNDTDTQAYNRYDANLVFMPAIFNGDLELRFIGQYFPNPQHDYIVTPTFASDPNSPVQVNQEQRNINKFTLSLDVKYYW